MIVLKKIKPIETKYNGYRFRSRLEARWAVYFDALGIEYEYEKEGYDLGELGWYLPDFWLPEYQTFAEVKGAKFTDDEINKCICVCNNIKDSCFLLLDGPPKLKPYRGIVNLSPTHIFDLSLEWPTNIVPNNHDMWFIDQMADKVAISNNPLDVYVKWAGF